MLETKDDKDVFEFPPETIKVIDKIGGDFGNRESGRGHFHSILITGNLC